MWQESLSIVPDQKNITIAENNPQSALTARKIREWEQLELVNKYWDSINNSNADIAVSLLTDKYKLVKEEEINKIVSDLTEPFIICPKVWGITFYINQKSDEKIMTQIKLTNIAGTWQISYIGEPTEC